MKPHPLKTFFLPTSHNDYRPKIFSAKSLAVLVAIFAFYQLVLHFAQPTKRLTAADLTTGNILSAVNREREARNLPALNADNRLSQAAQTKSDDMMGRHYFSHTDPEGEYIWPTIVAAGYSPYLQLGENLAIEFYNTESLVDAWMNSPTHRANILNENFQDQGMGLAFGNPQSQQYYSAIANTFGTLLPKKNTSTPPPVVVVPPPNQAGTSTPAPQPAKPASGQTPATSTPLTPPAPKVPLEIGEESLKFSPILKGALIYLKVSVSVSGSPNLVAASVGPRTATLSAQPGTGTSTLAYAGEVQLVPSSDMVLKILAQDGQGGSDSFEYALTEVKMPSPVPSQDSPVSPSPVAKNSFYDINRFVTLGFGGILLLLLITDIWAVLERKADHADKKINNLAVLIIALLVVALIYWL